MTLPLPKVDATGGDENFNEWKTRVTKGFIIGGKNITLSMADLHYKEYGAPMDYAGVLKSMVKVGLVNPLLVAVIDGEYRVYIGNQRLAAARHLAWDYISCVIVESHADVTAALLEYKKIPE
jgi:hypothetical protein